MAGKRGNGEGSIFQDKNGRWRGVITVGINAIGIILDLYTGLRLGELLGLTWENVDLKYENLVLVLAPVHELIHAVGEDTISSYLSALKLDASQLAKLNKLRILANRKPINLENLHLTNNSHNGRTKETKKTV